MRGKLRQRTRTMAVAAGALLTLVLSTVSAQATPQEGSGPRFPVAPANAANANAGNPYVMLSVASPNQRKCVGLADGGSTTNYTRLVLWDCHYRNDQWWYGGDGNTLRSYASGYPYGKCVGLANGGSTADGTRLVLWDCHYGSDQIWEYEHLANGEWKVKNRASGKCVGLANGSTANYTDLILWPCNDNPDHKWRAG